MTGDRSAPVIAGQSAAGPRLPLLSRRRRICCPRGPWGESLWYGWGGERGGDGHPAIVLLESFEFSLSRDRGESSPDDKEGSDPLTAVVISGCW
jgi:hypothetical protein